MANTDDTQDGAGSGCGGCLGIIGIAFLVIVVIGIFTEDPDDDSSTYTPSVTDPVTSPPVTDPEGTSINIRIGRYTKLSDGWGRGDKRA